MVSLSPQPRLVKGSVWVYIVTLRDGMELVDALGARVGAGGSLRRVEETSVLVSSGSVLSEVK